MAGTARSGKLYLSAGFLLLIFFLVTPVILFLGTEEEPDDPYGQCIIDGQPAAGSDSNDSGVKIPEQYRDHVEKAANTAGLPVAIIAAQIQQESDWNPKVVSPVGARGIAQFMPGSWEKWGNGKDPFDPLAGIDAMGRYMKYLGTEVADLATSDSEKVELTLAAYNAGPGAVAKFKGIPPYDETQNYVTTIMDSGQLEFSSTCAAPGGFDFSDLAPDEWAHPLPNSILTSPFGPRPCPLASCAGMPFLLQHEGIDLAGPEKYFYAPTDMKITYVSKGSSDELYGSYGNYIFAQMVDPPHLVFEFHEAKDNSLLVKTGDVVAKGTPLGEPGATGNSSGIHVHFQINDPRTAIFDRPAINNGKTFDPLPILRQQKVKI